jgi:hypothetical protein
VVVQESLVLDMEIMGIIEEEICTIQCEEITVIIDTRIMIKMTCILLKMSTQIITTAKEDIIRI